MAETEKGDGDDQLGVEKEERSACNVENPFVTEEIQVSENKSIKKVG
jgi:hypothetical protein